LSTKDYGAFYFEDKEIEYFTPKKNTLYTYKTYIGKHTIHLEQGDCIYYISKDKNSAILSNNVETIQSFYCATVIRGYNPPSKTNSLSEQTFLPYVNGCSTRQIFPPERLGDPTMQMLYIPPFTSEQAHHIHSTARVVYCLEGSGYSIVGMKDNMIKTELKAGMVIILEEMSPHHFETKESSLKVIPLHIYSSIGNLEFNHPMFNGTHIIG